MLLKILKLLFSSGVNKSDNKVESQSKIEQIEREQSEPDLIKMDELLKGRAILEDLPQDIQENLKETHRKINLIRQAYGKPMTVTSGLRIAGNQPINASPNSHHLWGRAVDIRDNPQGDLWFWVMKPENMQLIKDLGLWLEHGNWTHNDKFGNWVHFQIVPPRSGRRIFIPDATPDPNPTFWNGKYDIKYN